MKKIVVLGNSIAGIKAIEEIRKTDPSALITLFTLEEGLPYYRHLLADFVSGGIPKDQIYYQPKEYYQKLQINLPDEKINRIYFKRNRLTTQDNQRMDYDVLIITDTGDDDFSDIKGTTKSGVFCLGRLCDMNQLIMGLPVTETVVIADGGRAGFKMARALKKRDKEVMWIVASRAALPSDDPAIRIIEENAITEILGDSEVKAVKLKSGKVIAVQAVILGDARVDFKLFKDSGLQIRDRISVNEHFETNINNVFALNGVCDPGQEQSSGDDDNTLAVLEQQGMAVAAVYSGRMENACLP